MNRGDAEAAAMLFASDPAGFGGIVLRGDGPVRDAVLALIRETLDEGMPVRRLPFNIDETRLTGGLDLAATLAGGAMVVQRGLLAESDGGVLIVPMAERIDANVAGRLAAVLDTGAVTVARDGVTAQHAARIGLVLLDDGREGEGVGAALLDRCAFHIDCTAAQAESDDESDRAVDDAHAAIVAIGEAFGVSSARVLGLALKAFRMLGEDESALVMAARLVIGPRATRLPQPPDAAQQEPQQPPDDPGDTSENDAAGPLEDRVIEAVRVALPDDILAAIAARGRGKAGSGSAGEKRKSPTRGRPLGARAGMPRGGARLALIDTLRAAAPWQKLRGRTGQVMVRKSDIHIKRFESRAEAVTIFAVDASGSAAAARLGEAKGAVEILLAEAYVKRTQVALIAFRGEGAELLLPPTRSLTRARRALADLPGGGGTPLAAGLDAARELAEAVEAKGRSAFVVLLTDGRGNIAADGTPSRPQAMADAESAAKRIAARRIAAICIDTATRPRTEAADLATAMAGRYLPLPQGGAASIGAAVKALQV